jgi:hypothetical protein
MRVPPVSPAARVLIEAEEVNGRLGHENLGSLSAARGFLPARPPSPALPETHAPWDEVAARLPALVRDVALRRELDRMPVLPAGREALAGAALQRAATVLGLLGHAYVHLSGPAAPGLPASVALPWAEVRRRLGRSPEPVLAYTDLIVNNWRVAEGRDTAPVVVDNLRLLVPTVDNEEERVFYLTQVEILARCAPVVTAVTAAQQAVLDDDPEAVRHALDDVAGVLRTVTRRSLPLIDPRPGSPTHVDPVVWAKTVAPLAVPFRAGVLGPSGTASPVFNLLDAFLGRRGHASQLGAEIRLHRRSYPVSWRRFLAAVEEVSVPDHIAARPSPDLVTALADAREAYAGLEGFLGRHRRKVSGYLAVAFMVGRGVTIGGFAGSPRERTWHSVDAALTESRRERPCGDGGTPRSHPAAATPRGTAVPAAVRAGIGVADLAEHNDDEHGWWVAVEGRVHDVTGFVRRHPGGVAVLHAHAGLDATVAFGRAHVDRPGLRRLLRATDVGPLRHLDAVEADGLSSAWVAALSAVVHLQNALRLDRSSARGTDLCLADGTPASAFQVDRAIDTCARFEGQYLPQVATEVLRPLADHVDLSRGNRPPTPTGTARAAIVGPTAGPDEGAPVRRCAAPGLRGRHGSGRWRPAGAGRAGDHRVRGHPRRSRARRRPRRRDERPRGWRWTHTGHRAPTTVSAS